MLQRFIKLIFIIVTFSSCTLAKEKINTKVETGVIDKKKLQTLPYKNWFIPKYRKAVFDKELVLDIEKNIKNIKIKAFIGLWCSDSKRELPVFYKLLDEINFNTEHLEIVAVNYKKKAKHLTKGYNIIKVPTFIFYKNEEELGRFVEYPVESLEEDILKIISGKPYKHYYQD